MFSGLTEEQSRVIDDMLVDLLVRAEAEAVFLCDRGGNILAAKMVEHYQHDDNIAALAAGSFFATRELARLVGEPEFRCVFHEGSRKSLCMRNTDSDLLVLVFFGRESNSGIVKLFANKSCESLDEYFKTEGVESLVGQSMAAMELEIDDSREPFKRVRAPGAG